MQAGSRYFWELSGLSAAARSLEGDRDVLASQLETRDLSGWIMPHLCRYRIFQKPSTGVTAGDGSLVQRVAAAAPLHACVLQQRA